MQKIYGMISDNGDGSSSMYWFRNYDITEALEEKDSERWGSNDGGPAERLTFPDDLDLEECGFSFADDHYEHLILRGDGDDDYDEYISEHEFEFNDDD